MDDEVRRLFDRLTNPELQSASAECTPPLDVFDTADGVEVVVDVPGVVAEQIQVVISRNTLVVMGQKSPAACEHQREAAFHVAERAFGRFARGVRLAGAFDVGRADGHAARRRAARHPAAHRRAARPRAPHSRAGRLTCASSSSATSSASPAATSRGARSRRSSSSASIDFVIANVENSAAGFGVTGDIADTILGYGVDVMTSGNHIWDKKEDPRLHSAAAEAAAAGELSRRRARARQLPRRAREPANRSASSTSWGGSSWRRSTIRSRRRCAKIEALRAKTRVIIVDFHAEATSEKIAMGWHLDGRVTAVFGTHTHVQTADERILPKGTACLTDVGMTGPARFDHRRHRRGGALAVPQRHAGQVRVGHRARTAECGHRHRGSGVGQGDRDRAAESLGAGGRRARGVAAPSR